MKTIVMSHGQIRHWMAFLLKNGWRRATLARALATDGQSIAGKIRGSSWIMKGEQVRFTKQLRLILEGKLIQVGTQPVVADDPKPLALPARYVFDFASMRIKTVVPDISVQPMLPSWKDAFVNPRVRLR